MRAGRLRRRVALEQNQPTRAPDGGKRDNWISIATAWAEVRNLRGREFLTAKEFHAEVTTRIILRWRRGIDLEPLLWRVKTTDVTPLHTYQVIHVVDLDGRRRDLELLCSEVT